jgi:hypothetical protein
MKQHGMQLASLGYRVLPIRVGHKAPAISDWQNSHADEATVAGWIEKYPDAGVGVITENTPAIDIDCLDKDISYKLIKWVENNIGMAPVRIGRKPKALMVFRTDEPFGKIRSNEYVDFLGNRNAVEVLAKGQQFVAYATHPDTAKPYTWPKKSLVDIRHADLPVLTREQAQEFVAYFESIVPDDWELSRRGVSVTHSEEDELLTLRPKLGRTIDEIASWLDTVKNDDWHYDDWIKMGMAIHHETDGSPEGFRLWDDWSAQSDKYVHGSCGKHWRSFGRNTSVAPVTAAFIEGKAKKVEREERKKGLVDQLVQDLVFVQVGGKARVIREDELQEGLDLYGVEDLSKEFANQMIPVKSENKKGEEVIDMVNPIKLWLAHPERRTARGLVFLPEGQKVGYYNLWRGFSCEAEEGDVGQWLDYVHEVVADGNDAIAQYVIGWAAQLVQEPMTKPGVAMILRGLKGTGKSKFGQLIGKLFVDHYKTISRQDHLVGNFNAHLESCLLLQVEEGYWAGSKAAEGALKDLVTNDRIMVERKGVDGYMAPNYTRLLFTSNEEWVVPATMDERRWAVFDVSDRRKEDIEYFASLDAWFDRGGKTHLLHYLKHFDLSKVNIAKAPQTKALEDQKLRGSDCITRWLYECLASGEIRDARSGTTLEFGQDEVNKHLVYEAYRNSAHKAWEQKSEQAFWTGMEKYAGVISNVRRARTEVGRQRVVDISPLDEARKVFSAVTQLRVDWQLSTARSE